MLAYYGFKKKQVDRTVCTPFLRINTDPQTYCGDRISVVGRMHGKHTEIIGVVRCLHSGKKEKLALAEAKAAFP